MTKFRDSAVVAVDFRTGTRLNNSRRNNPFAATIAAGEAGDMSTTKLGTPPAPDVDDLVGKTLVPETFHVERKIGSGGMGEVYLVTEPTCGAKFAVKRLNRNIDVSPAMQRRIEEEGRRMARLNHPNIVKVVKTFRTDAGTFLVMEYVEGESLDAVIERTGPLPLDFVQEVMEQVLVAIGACHDIGIIHRDIKPENVLVTEVGFRTYAKVMDFGIAKLGDQDPKDRSNNLTREGAVFGSPEYMAPELWGGGAADSRTDVYALGTLLYALLTGRPPFSLKEVAKMPEVAVPYQKVSLMHLADKVPDPRFFRQDIPGSIIEVAYRALEKDAKDRFQSVEEMRSAMHTAFAAVGMALPRQSMLGGEAAAAPRSTAFRVSDPVGETVYPDGTKPVSRHPPFYAFRDLGTKDGTSAVSDPPSPKRSRRGLLAGIVAVAVVAIVTVIGVLVGLRYRAATALESVQGSIEPPAVKSDVAAVMSAPAVVVSAKSPAASVASSATAPALSLTPEVNAAMNGCLAAIQHRGDGKSCKTFCTWCKGEGGKHSFCKAACILAARQ